MISIGTNVTAISIGVGGLPGILSIYPEYWLNFLLAMAVAIVVPFVLTFIVGSRKLSREDRVLEPGARCCRCVGGSGRGRSTGSAGRGADHCCAVRVELVAHLRRPHPAAFRGAGRGILAGRHGRRHGI